MGKDTICTVQRPHDLLHFTRERQRPAVVDGSKIHGQTINADAQDNWGITSCWAVEKMNSFECRN
jgi:hypothetical protein